MRTLATALVLAASIALPARAGGSEGPSGQTDAFEPLFNGFTPPGYQTEIDPSVRAWTGGVYNEGRRGWIADPSANPDARAALGQNERNHVRVEAVGTRIREVRGD